MKYKNPSKMSKDIISLPTLAQIDAKLASRKDLDGTQFGVDLPPAQILKPEAAKVRRNESVLTARISAIVKVRKVAGCVIIGIPKAVLEKSRIRLGDRVRLDVFKESDGIQVTVVNQAGENNE